MKHSTKRNSYFVGIVTLLCLILYVIPTGFSTNGIAHRAYEKAKICSIDNSNLSTYGIVTTGNQNLELVILKGAFKGDTLKATNVLLGQKRLDKLYIKGDIILATLQLDATDSKVVSARAEDYYRQNYEWLLFLAFCIFLIAFAKWTGFKAILSFVFTALCLWKVLIPLFLLDYNPIVVAGLVVMTTAAVIILLVGGLNKKGLVALLGTTAGIITTATLAIVFNYWFKIPGTIQEFSEALLLTGYTSQHLSSIFIAAIFISSAGAVMDVAMDISASLDELSRRMPNLNSGQLMRSGFRIASPIIGSMTTTLLFAYSGSFLFIFMTFMRKGTPFEVILNTNYIAAEILHTLVGSFGLVLVAPLTAIIGGQIFHKKKPSS